VSVVANVAVNVDSRGAAQKLRALDAQAKKTESAFSKLGGVATKLAGAFALVGAAKFVFAKTAEVESQAKSLEVLTGSAQKATKIIKELQEIGRVTPFTSSELIESAKRLNAFGVSTEKVVETTKRLGDVSGATGAELSGLVTAYGQVQAKGRLQGEELLQFQERGVALQQELRKMYKLSGEEFQDALSKGKISAEAVEVAIKRLTDVGGKYANGAVAQSETLNGKMSTLQDNIEALARTLGEVMSPLLKAILDQAIQGLDAVNRLIASGRGGQFNRAIGGIGTKITFGATTEAVDDAEKFLRQVSSQKNRAGIEQNIQALENLSKALRRLAPTDPNAGRAVKLQGEILRLRGENIKALENLPKAGAITVPEVPELLGGRGKGTGERRGRAGKPLSQRIDEAIALLAVETELSQARLQGNKQLELQLEAYKRQLGILSQGLPLELQEIELKRNGLILDEQLSVLRKQKAEQQREFTKNLLLEVAAQQDVVRQFELQATKSPEFLRTLEQVNKLVMEGGMSFNDAFDKVTKLTKQTNVFEETLRGAGQILGNEIQNALQGLIQGTAEWGDLLSNVLGKLGSFLINAGLNQLAGPQGSGGILSFLGFGTQGRANGGTINANSPYVVGERGPEVFASSNNGTIIPGNVFAATRAAISGGASGTSEAFAANEAAMNTTNTITKERMLERERAAAMTSSPIDLRYESTVINSVEYVTAEQHRRGMAEAAERGRALSLNAMQNSVKTRKRLGMA
jgi:tape measure domain-containing protein